MTTANQTTGAGFAPNPFPAGTECAALYDRTVETLSSGHWSAKKYPGQSDPAHIIEAVELANQIKIGRLERSLDAAITNAETAIRLLRDLCASIELHTDCMTGELDRAAIEDAVAAAEQFVGKRGA